MQNKIVCLLICQLSFLVSDNLPYWTVETPFDALTVNKAGFNNAIADKSTKVGIKNFA